MATPPKKKHFFSSSCIQKDASLLWMLSVWPDGSTMLWLWVCTIGLGMNWKNSGSWKFVVHGISWTSMNLQVYESFCGFCQCASGVIPRHGFLALSWAHHIGSTSREGESSLKCSPSLLYAHHNGGAPEKGGGAFQRAWLLSSRYSTLAASPEKGWEPL